jgi:hypothetical protein
MTYIIGHSDKAKFARVFSFPDLLNFKCLNFILVSNHFWLDLWICDERWKSSSSLSQFRVRITSSHTPDSIFYPHHKPDPKPINLFDVGRRGLSGASHFFHSSSPSSRLPRWGGGRRPERSRRERRRGAIRRTLKPTSLVGAVTTSCRRTSAPRQLDFGSIRFVLLSVSKITPVDLFHFVFACVFIESIF